MKYYESHYEEYIKSVEKYNLHPELIPIWNNFPSKINQLENMIIYGPSAIGKYSQVLYLLKNYSPSNLKYEKKIISNTDKQQYIYHISDIHYEIDMALLGCNSKILWHEVFFQIIDIVSVKTDKIGIILCKNFHMIHSELLEIFYSYMQHYNHSQSNIKIKFFLITENLSFLPNTILNSSHIIRVKRPTLNRHKDIMTFNYNEIDISKTFQQRVTQIGYGYNGHISNKNMIENHIIKDIEIEGIVNIKEIRSFELIDSVDNIPNDVFNVICDSIIKEISIPTNIVMTSFRDKLYDILTYNLDINECLWYIITHFINNKNNESLSLRNQDITDILIKTYSFLKFFNNNYRPIFHLESIMYYIINKIHRLQ